MEFLIFGIIAYLIGSIPTAIWVGKIKYGIDVREHGSKNAGATNTFRVLGKKAGIFVLTVDILKGFIASFLPYLFIDENLNPDKLVLVQIMCSFLAVLGHVFPIYAGFKGGKGVATSLGVIIGVHPPASLVCIVIFLIVFIASNYVSLGAICGSFSFPISVIFIFKSHSIWLNLFSILLASVVILAHRKNIKRLIDGNENKMNLFKR
ncbi:MAG: glycerol-3-phosphate 1-O-acyltransferase PlsY [Crocinitomicaceae bacterium]|nr:glycerol-3-phosphate 1-O-acyltransferase PlsY [Crocinitomicaceae bacterium]